MRAIDADILEKKLKEAINMCMSIDTSGLSELKAVLEDVEEMPTIEPRCETCEAFNKTRLLIPQPQQKWIPCSERMPEKGQKCLVCDKGAIAIDTFIGNGKPYDWKWYMRDYEAWMALPEPYKKEGR